MEKAEEMYQNVVCSDVVSQINTESLTRSSPLSVVQTSRCPSVSQDAARPPGVTSRQATFI